MATAVSAHLSRLARAASSTKPGWVEAAAELTPALITSRIHCFRGHSHEDQIATVRQLPDFLTDHPGVLLVALDSVAFHFRHAYASDIGLRSRMLSKMAQQLNEVCFSFTATYRQLCKLCT
jgi:RAD51-like protein 2